MYLPAFNDFVFYDLESKLKKKIAVTNLVIPTLGFMPTAVLEATFLL